MDQEWKPPAGTEAYVASASSDDEGVTALVLAGDGFLLGFTEPPPDHLVSDGQVTISCFTPEALHVVDGHLRPDGSDGRLCQVLVEEIQHVQRRSEPRVEVNLSVTLTSLDGPTASVTGRTHNISTGGCRIFTEQPYGGTDDPLVSIRVRDDQSPVMATAAILDAQQTGGLWDYRMVFTDIALDDRARLSRLTRA